MKMTDRRALAGILLLAAEIALSAAAARADDSVSDLRGRLRALAGVYLPTEAAVMLTGTPGLPVVVVPATNEAWSIAADRGIARRAPLLWANTDNGPSLEALWPDGTVTVKPARLSAALAGARIGAGINRHPAAACQARLARSGGSLRHDAGPLRSGWRLVGGSVLADGARIGGWRAEGSGLVLELDGNDHDRTVRLPCLEVQAALGPAPETAITLADDLSALLEALTDGNAALDRIAEYQERLAGLARGDPAAARTSRLSVGNCREAATLAVICDRLKASFRTEPRPSEIGDEKQW